MKALESFLIWVTTTVVLAAFLRLGLNLTFDYDVGFWGPAILINFWFADIVIRTGVNKSENNPLK